MEATRWLYEEVVDPNVFYWADTVGSKRGRDQKFERFRDEMYERDVRHDAENRINNKVVGIKTERVRMLED